MLSRKGEPASWPYNRLVDLILLMIRQIVYLNKTCPRFLSFLVLSDAFFVKKKPLIPYETSGPEFCIL